ncbi:hypothetical protein [Acetobacter sp. DsW_063]|uniref:hypothetical protein n=1 Tax=Acetobacter sp. DsW_063 TaxID=1514894 RepID=UPI000A3B16F4|nr:hypothetical protein [Acetobacter sp. DsW_063]OUJ14709.1 hypothetical protein HK28_11825 [Acetobacter sp. DsW_063]
MKVSATEFLARLSAYIKAEQPEEHAYFKEIVTDQVREAHARMGDADAAMEIVADSFCDWAKETGVPGSVWRPYLHKSSADIEALIASVIKPASNSSRRLMTDADAAAIIAELPDMSSDGVKHAVEEAGVCNFSPIEIAPAEDANSPHEVSKGAVFHQLKSQPRPSATAEKPQSDKVPSEMADCAAKGGLKESFRNIDTKDHKDSHYPKDHMKKVETYGATESELEAEPNSQPASHRPRSYKPRVHTPRTYTPATQVERLLRAVEGSLESAEPANQVLAYNLTRLDEGVTDSVIRKTIRDAIRHHTSTSTFSVSMLENDHAGGKGLHCHMALHLPPGDYSTITATIRSRLAKRCSVRLKQLATDKGIPFKARETADSLYLRLLSVCPNDLPFWIAGEAPILRHDVIPRVQQYLSKSIDPSFVMGRRKDGSPITSQDMSEQGRLKTDLQKQSGNRPTRCVSLSRKAHTAARSDAGRADPDIIANTIIETRRIAKMAERTSALIYPRPKRYAPDDGTTPVGRTKMPLEMAEICES